MSDMSVILVGFVTDHVGGLPSQKHKIRNVVNPLAATVPLINEGGDGRTLTINIGQYWNSVKAMGTSCYVADARNLYNSLSGSWRDGRVNPFKKHFDDNSDKYVFDASGKLVSKK